jgi:uncharacterized repeat protein (TIGR03803 family)
MIRTKVTRTSMLAWVVATGKPTNSNQLPLRLAAWLACALAAIGIAEAQPPASPEKVLLNFANSAPKGSYLYSGVIRDPAGNLYGTTSSGSTAGVGTVYKVNAPGHVALLYRFQGGTDGRSLQAGVIFDSAGNLYGAIESGGAANAGVVYKLDTIRRAISSGPPVTAGPTQAAWHSRSNRINPHKGGNVAGAPTANKLVHIRKGEATNV